MPGIFEIMQEIEAIASNQYSDWSVGVTDNPERQREKLDKPKAWHVWNAESAVQARIIQKAHIQKGMRSVPGSGEDRGYVYIFSRKG